MDAEALDGDGSQAGGASSGDAGTGATQPGETLGQGSLTGTPPQEGASGTSDGGEGETGPGPSASCASLPTTCQAALDLGTVIGTAAKSVAMAPDAKPELTFSGKGGGFVKVHVVDQFSVSAFDFNNLVGLGITLVAQPESSYEISLTGGATDACGMPYPKHIAQTDATGVAKLSSVFARYTGMPPLSGTHFNDYQYLHVQIRQLSGSCATPYLLQIKGFPCSSNCAWNSASPCNQEKAPKTCDEVTD